MSADDIRARTQGVWDQFYSWRNIWARVALRRVAEVAAGVRADLEAYRQMYANTGIATDSARINRSATLGALDREAAARSSSAGKPMPELQVPRASRRSCKSVVVQPARVRMMPLETIQTKQAAALGPPHRLEAQPFAKTGGLADVLGALPPALAAPRLGRDRRAAAIPRRLRRHSRRDLSGHRRRLHARRRRSTRRRSPTARARSSSTVRISTIAPALYGVDNTDYPDNARRFAFLARAALEFAARRGAAPSVVHAHDWQAGLAPVYLRTLYASHPVLGGTPSVFTIHNLAYQGMLRAGLAAASRSRLGAVRDRSARVLGPHQLPEGRHQRRRCRSRPSARDTREEIQTPAFGFGFDGILRARADGSGRHPERHRHARVGSGARSRSCRRRSTPAISPASATRRSRCCSRYGLPGRRRRR